jgi:hypothetical protein
MRRTTVYVPDALKAAIERVAAETGCSEAKLIREGIRLAVEHHRPPLPRSGIFASGEASLSERTDDLLSEFGRT